MLSWLPLAVLTLVMLTSLRPVVLNAGSAAPSVWMRLPNAAIMTNALLIPS